MGGTDSKQLRQAVEALEGGLGGGETGLAHRVDLQGLPLAERDARRLAEVLRRRKLQQLKLVRLGNCALTPRALEYITRSLCAAAPFPHLTRVELVRHELIIIFGNKADGEVIFHPLFLFLEHSNSTSHWQPSR